jgi:2'-hydroxyisoflavone reductase
VRVLVFGGTVFLGRHLVEAALARGHQVTLFNRGRHNPHLFPRVEKLRGDRNADLSPLSGRSFDAVLDPSAYTPRQVQTAAEALDGRSGHYTFISSVSAYRELPPGRAFDETSPKAEGDQGYGALKARAEEILEARMPGQVAHVRPGLIVGPYDPTDRFTYWPRRVARGGDVLAPGRPDRRVQFVDARDLADWCVRLAEAARAGAFNAVGPLAPLTMEQLLEECRAALAADARFHWVSDETLLAAGVEPWSELPLWIPEADPNRGGLMLADNRRAREAGLTMRPVSDTVRDTFEWDRAEGGQSTDRPSGTTSLSAERERELLAALA